MSSFKLLTKKKFGPFFWTQFLGALNDNVFKNALIILITFSVASSAAGGAEDGPSAGLLVNLAAGLFVLPWFLFSGMGGQIADRSEKANLIRIIKGAEIGIMGLGAVGLYFQNFWFLLGVLTLMGVQSALFGPVKFSILPQHLSDDELVGGNAMVEMGTFLAILLGTLLGGVLVAIEGVGPQVVAGVVVGIAIFGYLSSRGIPSAKPADPTVKVGWNPLLETFRTARYAKQNRPVFLSILGISWFWFYGALFLAQLPGFTKDILGGDEHVTTAMLAIFSVGIGVGSILCERLSGPKVELGLVPLGSIGLSAFAIDLYFATAHMDGSIPRSAFDLPVRVGIDLLLIGIFGGFFIVPLYAMMQQRSEDASRSRVIAANNIINSLFMVVSAGAAIGMLSAGLTIPEMFLITGIVNAFVAFYIYGLLPEFTLRFVVWMLMHSIYKLRTEGTLRLPEKGPALLVCNHVSFVDALILSAAFRRPIRFVMDHRIFRTPLLGYLFRAGGAIPIASKKEDPERLRQAMKTVADGLSRGDVICIFPEGRLTPDGTIQEFRPGVERILQQTPVPVLPMALRGLWGSLFSRRQPAVLKRRPRKLWARIELVCGELIEAKAASASHLYAKVSDLRGDLR